MGNCFAKKTKIEEIMDDYVLTNVDLNYLKDYHINESECAICMDSQAEVLSSNCRHQAICLECLQEIKRRFNYVKCPVCQIPITNYSLICKLTYHI